MRANVCGTERRIRGIVGVILIVIGFIVAKTVGWILGIIGLVLMLTAIISYCPLNALFGRNSCRAFIRDPLRDREMSV